MAEIAWLGRSCVRIRTRDIYIVTDPYPRALGHDIGKPKADIVTISRRDADYANMDAIKGTPKVLDGPGEYEVNEVFITGIATYADDKKGAVRGRNTVYVYTVEGMIFAHLGALGGVPSSDQVAEMSNIDVLFVPVGGGIVLNAKQASEVISMLEPHIVVPIHYKAGEVDGDLDDIARFAKEMGLADTSPQEKLVLRPADVPEGTRVVVLDPHNSYK